METLLNEVASTPLLGFTLLLLVVLTLPPLFERLRLPGLVGLLFAGVVLGPAGLQLLDPASETIKLLSDIGKIYLMFVAGLEIDLDDFRKQKYQALGFGLATFLLPLAAGTLVGYGFGFGWNASILLGSLLASHTLLGYPIVRQLGVANSPAVTATIGATIFTDIAALLVLAICISIHSGEFTATTLVVQLAVVALYAALVLFGLDWAGRKYFQLVGDEESNQFLFVLLAVFIVSAGAQVINVDKIVGAFLAGLAINDVVGRSPVEDKVVFVGSTLFIPFFFVGMGLIIDLDQFIAAFASDLGLIAAILAALFGGKFLAAVTARLLYRYGWNETATMWSLSLPQVAATLAAALAGFNAGLLPQAIFNAVIVLMLVTAVAGPILTAKFAPHISAATLPEDGGATSSAEADTFLNAPLGKPFTVMVPVANPKTERNLIELGALLVKHETGRLLPLAIAKGHVRMDAPELDEGLQQAQALLRQAVEVGHEFGVEAKPWIRISDDIARGISRSAKEAKADLLLLGWSSSTRLTERLAGSVVDSVFWAAHCPVAVVRLVQEPVEIDRILVPVRDLSSNSQHAIEFALLFADTHNAKVKLFHVSKYATREEMEAFESEMLAIAERTQLPVPVIAKVIRYDNVARAIVKTAKRYDMVMLRSIRRRTSGGLAISDLSTQVLERLSCSVVLLGEPQA
ncbi:cation:proton antiporter [Synechococcus sp. PCC 7336]|uniref:cation:proton antiporter domain-containing protein n=1 Tax=Synechococcus sp. PCC 7336 TaxID=195250 RepID=UPI00034B5377|nr:cation:proton antiporter [Synechococcus sp. PCC 7336]